MHLTFHGQIVERSLKHIPVGLNADDFLNKLEYELYSELESIR